MAENSKTKLLAGKIIAATAVVAALVLGSIALWITNVNPRTDDADVIANYVGIAPEVEGRIISLPVKDNQWVRKGDLLYEIDPEPYKYKLQQAISSKNNLDQQIIDERRKIKSEQLDVEIATEGQHSDRELTSSQEASSKATDEQISQQEAAVKSADVQYRLAADNLTRTEPLLARHFVTAQQIDQLRTTARAAQESLSQAKTKLNEAHANLQKAQAGVRQSVVEEKRQKLRAQQAQYEISRLETLTSQRLAKEAAVKSAAYDLERCHVHAPFDARVTNLNISVGQYARTGGQVFALIDTTAWWVLGNYKETQLRHLAPGMPVDVYLLTRPDIRFKGVVESVSFGVTPEDITQGQTGGLSTTTRTLNWVRLAQRFPVRVRILNPLPDLFRIGASATAIVRSQDPALPIPVDPDVYNTALYKSFDGNSQSAVR